MREVGELKICICILRWKEEDSISKGSKKDTYCATTISFIISLYGWVGRWLGA